MSGAPTFGVPSPVLPATDTKTGKFVNTWYQFIARLAQLTPERPFAPQAVGASPWTFTADTIGDLFVTGGTTSSIVLSRSGISLTVASGRFIPMAAGDTVAITYTVAPTVTFVPSARA